MRLRISLAIAALVAAIGALADWRRHRGGG